MLTGGSLPRLRVVHRRARGPGVGIGEGQTECSTVSERDKRLPRCCCGYQEGVWVGGGMHTAAKRGAAHPLLLTTAPTLLAESSPAPLPS